MSVKTFFQDLKVALEGKTVITVEPPRGIEHVVRITTSDGNTFEIGGGGDFGNWVAKTKNNKDECYTDLTIFFSEYYAYCYWFDIKEPIITIGDIIVFTASDGKEFKLNTLALSPFEKRVTEQNVEVLKFAALMGDAWRACLDRNAYDADYPELDELKAESWKILNENA